MLSSLWLQVSEVSYPHFSLPILIFGASLISFLLGYYPARIISKPAKPSKATCYRIDVTRLRRFNWLLTCGAVGLMTYNYKTEGLPPLFAFLGFSTESVNAYGRMKQLIGPLEMAVFVNAFLDPSAKRRIAFASFGFIAMLLYVARGSILLMAFQALVVLSVRSSMTKKRLYLVAGACVTASAVFFGILGNYRTSNALLFAGMQIKTEFQQWPTMWLWVVSYVSAPLSNLCWFVETARFKYMNWSFAYNLLPSFWTPQDPHAYIKATSKIVDGVSTYLANYFLDMSYAGIVFINVVLGAISGYGSVANRICKNALPWSVFLSCIAFMCFWDFLATLGIVILMCLELFAHRYCVLVGSSDLLTRLPTAGHTRSGSGWRMKAGA